MECSTPGFDVNVDPTGYLIDLDSLCAHLARLRDRRDARGVRYALVSVLVYLVLAKLAGQDRLLGISQWVRYRKKPLAQIFHLKVARAPCANTYRNILTHGIDIDDLEQVVREFFANQPKAGHSLVIALGGKTVQGTIAAGQTHGQHLLAACWPGLGALPGRSRE